MMQNRISLDLHYDGHSLTSSSFRLRQPWGYPWNNHGAKKGTGWFTSRFWSTRPLTGKRVTGSLLGLGNTRNAWKTTTFSH